MKKTIIGGTAVAVVTVFILSPIYSSVFSKNGVETGNSDTVKFQNEANLGSDTVKANSIDNRQVVVGKNNTVIGQNNGSITITLPAEKERLERENKERMERERKYEIENAQKRIDEIRRAIVEFAHEMQKLDTFNIAVAHSYTSESKRWGFMLTHSPKTLERMHPLLMSRFNGIRALIDSENKAHNELLRYITSVRNSAFKDTLRLDEEKSTVYSSHINSDFWKRVEVGLKAIEKEAFKKL